MEEEFQWPYFFNYPPYFTLQPVKDTREKQIQLWKELVLKYCKHHKVFIIHLEDDIPLFVNNSIDRKLTYEARQLFLGALVAEGRAEWLDKGHRKCLIHWRKVQDWAETVLQFVRDHGMEDGVMTIEEIRSGDETRGTDLAGIDRTVLIRALKLLEQRGKAAIFKGTSEDDEGVKFSAQWPIWPFIDVIRRPVYMDVHMSHAMRIAIGQMRVSSHQLFIETGRAVGVLSQDRICRLCHTEVETEEHYICKCTVYYEIGGRFHCLFVEGFGPLARIMDFPDQRCLALFLLEIRKHCDRVLRAPPSPLPVTQPVITSIYHSRGDAEERRDTRDDSTAAATYPAPHGRRVPGVTVQLALAIQRTRRPRPPRGAPMGRQISIRDILQRHYDAPRSTAEDVGSLISTAIDCPMADILDGGPLPH